MGLREGNCGKRGWFQWMEGGALREIQSDDGGELELCERMGRMEGICGERMFLMEGRGGQVRERGALQRDQQRAGLALGDAGQRHARDSNA
eukprot:476051-Rhodomonas_salina.2